MSKNITVTALKPLGGSGKLSEATFDLGGKSFTAKTWANDGLEVGKTYDVELERKEEEYRGEKQSVQWIKVPRRGGGGFGGGKSDPARAENDRRRLEFEERKHEDFLRKWDDDRVEESRRQASIQAQVILKAAVDLCVARGDLGSIAVDKAATDLASTLLKVHRQVSA